MNAKESKPAESRYFDPDIVLGPDATIGEKLKALRMAKRITVTALSRATEVSERTIRYIENNDRTPGVELIKKFSAALGVGTDYFMDDDLFQVELQKEQILSRAKEKYGARGMSQAKMVYESAKGLYAGGRLNEEERDAFRDMMMELFFETKEEAQKYVPSKYRK